MKTNKNSLAVEIITLIIILISAVGISGCGTTFGSTRYAGSWVWPGVKPDSSSAYILAHFSDADYVLQIINTETEEILEPFSLTGLLICSTNIIRFPEHRKCREQMEDCQRRQVRKD